MFHFNPTKEPVPDRLKKRPMFHGVPVPFTVHYNADETPDFRVTDNKKWEKCVRFRLCGLCGDKLGAHIVFIGGAKSMESGMFFDPPMHLECATYAFRVCPFIAAAKEYSMRESKPAPEGVKIVTSEVMPTERPARMGMLKCKGYRMVQMAKRGEIFYNAVGTEPPIWQEEILK